MRLNTQNRRVDIVVLRQERQDQAAPSGQHGR
jgi:hypothetical protein